MQMIPSLDCMVDFTWPIHSYKSFLWNCEYLGYRIFFFANILPKYFFNLSKDLSFPLRVNIVKSLKKNQNSHFSRKNLITSCPCSDILYIRQATISIQPPLWLYLPHVQLSGRSLMTDISFWPYAHVLSSSHEQFPPQQKGGIPFTFICGVVPTKQHGLVKWHLPFIQGFQEVIKVKEFVRIFFCETLVARLGLVANQSHTIHLCFHWANEVCKVLFWYLVAINFHPSPWKKNKNKIFNMFTNNMILLLIVILNTRSKSNPCNFLMENSLIWNP